MKSLSRAEALILRSIALRVTPNLADLDAEGDARFYSIVDRALLERPPGVQRQFRLFLRILRWSSLLPGWAPFERLSPERQDEVLRRFQDCPIALLRKGFWGLKILIFMGYYGQTELWETLGYSPDREGNTYLHARETV